MIQSYNRGEIYWYDFGNQYENDRKNRIYTKRRPVVIVSNDLGNHNSGIVTIAPITSKLRQKDYPFQVAFKNGTSDNVICLEQCRTINNYELLNYIGRLDEVTMKKLDNALAIAFNIPIADENKNEVIFLERLDYRLNNLLRHRFNNYNCELNDVKNNMDIITNHLKDIEHLLVNLCKSGYIFKSNNDIDNETINKNEDDIEIINNKGNDELAKQMINSNMEIKKEDNIKNKHVDGRKSKVTTEDMIEFLNLYNEYSMEDMCELYECDAKRISNLRYRYLTNLKKQNINIEMKNKRQGRKRKGDN